jgi:Replication-relaxation
VMRWLTDRAGWQEWTRSDRWSSHQLRLTPDAVATFTSDGAQAVTFVEVDLASMTQTVLKQKVARYLAYADDLAWQEHYPYCPPMLLLTTTATRAVSFLRAAGQVIAKHRQRIDGNDRAAMLAVGACGLVRDPARAVTEPRWALPDTSIADLTFAEILAERAEAKEASDAWLYERDVVQRRRDDIGILRSITQFGALADWLGSDQDDEVLRAFIGIDPAAFLDTEPHLAAQVIEWFTWRHRLNRFQARDLAQPLVAALEARHDTVWQEQAQLLLAAKDELADIHPRRCRLAATLAAGKLASVDEIAALNDPPNESRAEVQRGILEEYHARRTDAVNEEWSRLGWRERRRNTRDRLEVAYDEQHLLICDTCALVYPMPPTGEPVGSRCGYCDGAILDWPERTSVPVLAHVLNGVQNLL